jgi:hypothetical protein
VVATDLAGMYARQHWIEGWKAAAGDRLVRSKINEINQEISQEMAREIDHPGLKGEACQK